MSRTSKMDNLDSNGPTPALRFPEFDDGGAWQRETLCRLASPVKEKATGGDNEDTLTLSGEMGLVPQGDYFGKQISGENVSRYIKIVRDDFVYNDRTTKASKFGSIKRLSSTDGGIVSPIYKCFRFKGSQNPDFWDYYFEAQAHEAQLGGLVNEGARAGRFNISIDKFLSIDVWKPSSPEQERIAECLASIDTLIEVETEKLDALKDHKQGLMQQLFPAEGESLPALRFTQFEDQEDWRVTPLGDECDLYQPQTLSKSQLSEDGEFLVYGANGVIGRHVEYNHAESEVIVTCRGATCGEVHQSKPMSWITGNAMVVRPKSPSLHKDFLAHLLRADGLQSVITGSAQPQITRAGFAPLPVSIPSSEEEQEAVASTISSVDTLISAQKSRVEVLKNHKLGLLQKLFPVLDEVDG